jgi:hypothetical protein
MMVPPLFERALSVLTLKNEDSCNCRAVNGDEDCCNCRAENGGAPVEFRPAKGAREKPWNRKPDDITKNTAATVVAIENFCKTFNDGVEVLAWSVPVFQ